MRFGMVDNALLERINKLLKENSSLKQQVIEQQNIIKDIELHDISKDIAHQINIWMDKPIPNHKSEEQDIKEFAFGLTKYLEYKLRS